MGLFLFFLPTDDSPSQLEGGRGEEVVYDAAQLSINMLLRSIQEKIVLLEF